MDIQAASEPRCVIPFALLLSALAWTGGRYGKKAERVWGVCWGRFQVYAFVIMLWGNVEEGVLRADA